MQRSPAEPYAALTRRRRPPCRCRRRAARSCGSSRRRAPARACRASSPSRRCTCAIGRRADERDGRDVRVLEQRVDGDLVAVDDVEDAVGQAGLLQQLGRRRSTPTDPSRDGFSTKRVAAGDRGRPHPHRHHRREVERRDAGDDAERLADRVDVDARSRPARRTRPSSSVGIPQANSTTSRPRATSPIASESTLPCSAVRIRARSSRCVRGRARGCANISSARFASDVVAPRRRTPPSRTAPRRRPPRPRRGRPRRSGRREPGCRRRPLRPDVPSTRFPPIQWGILVIAPPGSTAGASASSVMADSSRKRSSEGIAGRLRGALAAGSAARCRRCSCRSRPACRSRTPSGTTACATPTTRASTARGSARRAGRRRPRPPP